MPTWLWIAIISGLVLGLVGGFVFYLMPSEEPVIIEERVIREEIIDIRPDMYITFLKPDSEELSKLQYEIFRSDLRYPRPSIKVSDDVSKVHNVIKTIPFEISFSVGERPTGGYRVNVEHVKVNYENNNIYIFSSLSSPGPAEMVTQAFTYPSAGVRILDNLASGNWRVQIFIEIEDKKSIMLTDTFKIEK